jgi:type II pantothenate kinase
MILGIDFGTTNTDAVCVQSLYPLSILHQWTLPAMPNPNNASIQSVVESCPAASLSVLTDVLRHIAVTGGNRKDIPAVFRYQGREYPISQHLEIPCIARGGLVLSCQQSAIVVSAGSGTAVVKAEFAPTGTAEIDGDENNAYQPSSQQIFSQHLTGTGIGGGTMMGLAALIVHTTHPSALDALAMQGSAEAINLTLHDVLGGPLGRLPADATAVNFGRVARAAMHHTATVTAINTNGQTPHSSFRPDSFRTEDLAAALVELVSQTIAVVAINAARTQQLSDIVLVGHLTDMKSMHSVFQRVSEFAGVNIHIPNQAGYAVALGAALEATLKQPV